MAKIIKRIPVKNKEEAIRVMNALMEKYGLVLTDPDNSLDASNEPLHVFYDAEAELVIVETNDAHSTETYIKELLIDFPTFF